VVLIFERSLLSPSSRKKKEAAGSLETLVHNLWKSKTYDKQYKIGWDWLNSS